MMYKLYMVPWKGLIYDCDISVYFDIMATYINFRVNLCNAVCSLQFFRRLEALGRSAICFNRETIFEMFCLPFQAIKLFLKKSVH